MINRKGFVVGDLVVFPEDYYCAGVRGRVGRITSAYGAECWARPLLPAGPGSHVKVLNNDQLQYATDSDMEKHGVSVMKGG
jgi:hypothetical protein